MVFNKPAYTTIFFSDKILVKCPKCSKVGLITNKAIKSVFQKHNGCDSVFKCKYCHHKLENSNKWFGYYQGYISRACGFCGSKINYSTKPTKEPFEKQKVKCDICNKEKEYELQWFRYKTEKPTDPYFGLELLLQTNIKTETIWLYNIEHLRYLRDYVHAKIRIDDKRHKYSMITNLPKFIKSAKNRDEIVKKLNNLEAEYEQMVKEYFN